MEIYTIGFTQKSAERFFGLLTQHEIRRLIDVRLNNSGQLAGFTKQSDLQFFLRSLCDADYVHQPLLAPTKALLTGYRKGEYSWSDYEHQFDGIMRDRAIESTLDRGLFADRSVLLCSEPTPEQCHRRLVAEYLQRHWPTVSIVHL